MRPPIYIDVLAVSGKVLLQSFPVDDAIVGQDLINLVKKHLGKHDEICKLLHKHDPIEPLVGLAEQNITECSQLTAVFCSFDEERQRLLVKKIWAREKLNDEEMFVFNHIVEMKWWFGGLENIIFPTSLQHLSFMDCDFNEPLPPGEFLPAGLLSLSFGPRFNQLLDNTILPATLQKLEFGYDFNQSLDNTTLPQGLAELRFCKKFNQPLDGTTLPRGLQILALSWNFNQSLDNTILPTGLQKLLFSFVFNQSLDNATLPNGLQELEFSTRFNQTLANTTLPSGLQKLKFGDDFNQSLDNTTLPSGLQYLSFGLRFNQPTDNVVWPSSLTYLSFSFGFAHTLNPKTLPRGIQVYIPNPFRPLYRDEIPDDHCERPVVSLASRYSMVV